MGSNRVLEYFKEISAIPRVSYEEDQIAQYLLEKGQELGLLSTIDSQNNVILKKEKKIPDSPCVILQAHMDMVWASDLEEDPTPRIPQKIKVTDGIMKAQGTSLGADNGIGVALILALLEENLKSDVGIEGLFTSNEEETMGGALALKEDQLSGSYLINLDSEQEGVFTIGSAGGISVTGSFYLKREARKFCKTVKISVSGGIGGHSGLDIGKKRENAILLLVRFLHSLGNEHYQLCSIDGGERSNAIPQRACAVIVTDDVSYFSSEAESFLNSRGSQWQEYEPEIKIGVKEIEDQRLPLTSETRRKTLMALDALPHGVYDQTEEFVCSSVNLALLKTEGNTLEIELSLRSSYDLWCIDQADKIGHLIEFFGGEFQQKDYYAAWEFHPHSRLKGFLGSTYYSLFQKPARFENVHAGVECGIIMDNCSSVKEAVSLGPTIKNAHTTSETLDVSSVEKVFELLNTALNNIGGLEYES